MIERFKTYFETLESLSTEELDRSVEKLVRSEKRSTALVIAHIAEMSRRKGALERGYKNLFDYCVRRLNLSEGSVALRLQVANVSRRFPRLLAALAENRMSLTLAGLLAPHLTEENVERLVAECSGMTKREAEDYLVSLRPRPVFTPSIRKAPATGMEPREISPSPPVPAAVSEPPAPPPASRPSPSILQPATPAAYNFRFAAGKEFKDKFERLAEVLGVESPLLHMAEILEQAVDIALDKKDVKRRLERRKERQRRLSAESPRQESRPNEIGDSAKLAASRYLASEVQERVHARAGYQCEFRGPDGTRCRARAGLEIEHERPFGIYRSHDERFLKLYCKAHNRLSAERVYGADFMRAMMDASRKRRRRAAFTRTT